MQLNTLRHVSAPGHHKLFNNTSSLAVHRVQSRLSASLQQTVKELPQTKNLSTSWDNSCIKISSRASHSSCTMSQCLSVLRWLKWPSCRSITGCSKPNSSVDTLTSFRSRCQRLRSAMQLCQTCWGIPLQSLTKEAPAWTCPSTCSLKPTSSLT